MSSSSASTARSSGLPPTTSAPRTASGCRWRADNHGPVRVRADQVHPRFPRGAPRGSRVAEEGTRHRVGQATRRALPGAADAPRAARRRQRAHLRTDRRLRVELQGRRDSTEKMNAPISNVRPAPDKVLTDIADYVSGYEVKSADAYDTARHCLMDTLGCGFEALEYPACTKLLRPVLPGTLVPHGARVPGTQFQLDPVQAAFNLGTMIRWLDFNDTWLAAEWGHPSDNLGGILMAADWMSRNAIAAGSKPLTVHEVLTAMIKAHEIQGVIALENSFNRVGLDHVVLVKVATTAVVAQMLGLTRDEIIDAVSLAWVDGQSL